jgi:hypothetical protein
VCGLAGLLAGDAAITDALRATLETLAGAQGPDGQIPSNVQVADGQVQEVSYGGLCGRVDALPWFVIGVCNLAHTTGDVAFAGRMRPALRRALDLLTTWEYNRRGLVYVPEGGDWADEYMLHGYVLYDQLLRLWAIRCYAALFDDAEVRRQADALTRLLERTYWPSSADGAEPYHPYAYQRYLDEHGEPSFWLPALAPSGYATMFDAWSNALAVLLALGDARQHDGLLDHGHVLADALPHRLVPAFWPPIAEGDPGWTVLQANHRGTFQNRPGHYHNGGAWPIINGWWGAALCVAGRADEAHPLLRQIHAANRQGQEDDTWTFAEYLDADQGAPGGTPRLAWSAAGTILLTQYLAGQSLFFG